MKFALIALSLLVSAQVFAKTITCTGNTEDNKAVSIVIAVDDASGSSTSIATSVNGSEVSKFEGAQVLSGMSELPTDDGGSIPAFITVGADSPEAPTKVTLTVIVDIDDSNSVAVAGIAAEGVAIEGVQLACTKN